MPAQVTAATTLVERNQYDTAPPIRAVVLDDDGDPIDVVALGIVVTIDIARASGSHHWSPIGRIVENRMMASTAVTGEVIYSPVGDDLAAPGEYHWKVNVIYPDGTKQTLPSGPPLALKVHARVGGP